MGSKEAGLRYRLVSRGMMRRWSGREGVRWGQWRNLAKRTGEADCRIRLSSPALVTISSHSHDPIISSLHIILLQRSSSRKLSCSAARAWDRVVARPVTVYTYCTNTGEVLCQLYN
jgi:hypothetical protein